MLWLTAGVQLLIGVATVLVARAVGLRNARATTEATAQREIAARREEWWRRMQWALTAAAGDGEVVSAVGLAMLNELVRSDMATPEERALARAAARPIVRSLDPTTPQGGY